MFLKLKPYDKEYLIKRIKEYNKLISVAKVNDFEIKSFENKAKYIDGYMYRKKENLNINILELHGPNNILMRISPIEIESSYMFIKKARGKVGIVGLGLGYVVQELLKKDDVEEIIVYEIEKDVIDLYYLNFSKNKKLKIINEDAYKAKSRNFDYFYVDIYEYKFTYKVVEDYEIFNKIHNIKEYLFWGLEHFLLSCRYEEIVWVYIPELWMEISRSLFEAFQDANMLKYYNQLEPKLVSEVLSKFKVLLD